MIYYLPLEHLDKRYTSDLDSLLEGEFKKQNKKYVKVDGDILPGEIKTGAFLDSDGTNYFKFSQLQKVASLFREGKINSGDTFFVSDLWFPGLESIPYMAYFHNIKVSIKGLLHAGSWTRTDYVEGMEDWAKYIEMGWFRFIDTIFVGSNFIKQELIDKGRITRFGTLVNVGLPFNPENCYELADFTPWKEKHNWIVFAGRINDEKQPWKFDDIKRRFEGENVLFFKTMELKLTKQLYYEMLSRSKVMFSSALQENFGYAALEGATYGCNLVVPNDLAYTEKYPKKYRYDTLDEAEAMIRKFLKENNTRELVSIAKGQKDNVKKIVEQL